MDIPAEFDVETLAEQAVELLPVAPGQVIWVWASTHSLDLIAALWEKEEKVVSGITEEYHLYQDH